MSHKAKDFWMHNPATGNHFAVVAGGHITLKPVRGGDEVKWKIQVYDFTMALFSPTLEDAKYRALMYVRMRLTEALTNVKEELNTLQ